MVRSVADRTFQPWSSSSTTKEDPLSCAGPAVLRQRQRQEQSSRFEGRGGHFLLSIYLVLGCIEAEFYVQIFIFQHFSRSTRSTYLCTAPYSKFADFFSKFSLKNDEFSRVLQIFCEICSNLHFFAEIFTDFYRNCEKC